MRRLFWDENAAMAGDNPDFPEFLSPQDPAGWRAIHEDGYWYTYTIYAYPARNPLYVGSTANVARRLADHQRDKAWWPLATEIIVGRHTERVDALECERRMIEFSRPLMNTVHNQHTCGPEVLPRHSFDSATWGEI